MGIGLSTTKVMCATMFIGGKTELPMKLKKELIYAAIDGFTIQKAHLNQRIAELREMLNGGSAQAGAVAEREVSARLR